MSKGMSKLARHALALGLFVSTALASASVISPEPAAAQSYRERRAVNAFFNSRYTYCDAKMIGALWGMTPYQGKAEIGYKIIGGYPQNLGPLLAQSRSRGNRCSWQDTGYSYRDAERLANYWGYRYPYQAKTKAARLLTEGRGHWMKRILGH